MGSCQSCVGHDEEATANQRPSQLQQLLGAIRNARTVLPQRLFVLLVVLRLEARAADLERRAELSQRKISAESASKKREKAHFCLPAHATRRTPGYDRWWLCVHDASAVSL